MSVTLDVTLSRARRDFPKKSANVNIANINAGTTFECVTVSKQLMRCSIIQNFADNEK